VQFVHKITVIRLLVYVFRKRSNCTHARLFYFLENVFLSFKLLSQLALAFVECSVFDASKKAFLEEVLLQKLVEVPVI
jgi:hypothetical protein